jgi:Flp pilus assembly pilin Flp
MIMLTFLKNLWRNEEANELISWALIAAIVAAIIVAVWGTGLSEGISGAFETIIQNLETPPT